MTNSINSIATPFIPPQQIVRPEWVDYNGHMNVAYYVLAFDLATEALLNHVGLGEDKMRETGHSVFTVDMNVTYTQEVMVGKPLRFESWLLELGNRKLKYIHQMFNADEGYLAATNSCLIVNVDMAMRKTTPFLPSAYTNLENILSTHASDERFSDMATIANRILGQKT